MMHGEIIVLYLLLDNRHSRRSALVCVCAIVCPSTRVCVNGCVFLQEEILI